MHAETTKIFTSVTKGGTRKTLKGFERDVVPEKARSLSRPTQPAGRARLEESKTFIGTPRGSIVEPFAASKSTLSTTKAPKLMAIRKERPSEEKVKTKKSTKDKKRKETASRKDNRSKEKEFRTTNEKIWAELRSSTGAFKKSAPVNKKKPEKKNTLTKESHNALKPNLKKKFTLDDEDFTLNLLPEHKTTKNCYAGSPREDSATQNQIAMDRLRKCLQDRPMRQISETRLKKSFKGELVAKIKVQAFKMARKGSKEAESASPAVEGLAPLYSHRDPALNRPTAPDQIDEFLDKLRTEHSVSTCKRSSGQNSPAKRKDISKKNTRQVSLKNSPPPRPGKHIKPVPFSSSKKEPQNKSNEKKLGVQEGHYLRQSQAKQGKYKPTKALLSHLVDPSEDKEFKTRGFVVPAAVASLKSPEYARVRMISRAIPDDHCSLRSIRTSRIVENLHLVPRVRVSTSSIVPFQCAMHYFSKDTVKETANLVFESKPDYPDQPTPQCTDGGDLGAARYIPCIAKQTELLKVNLPASPLEFSSEPQTKARSKKARQDECMEDIPNLPQEKRLQPDTPQKDRQKIRSRAKPVIVSRAASGISSITTSLFPGL